MEELHFEFLLVLVEEIFFSDSCLHHPGIYFLKESMILFP